MNTNWPESLSAEGRRYANLLGRVPTETGIREDAEIKRLRVALQKIADLPVQDSSLNKGRTEPRAQARRIAIAALSIREPT